MISYAVTSRYTRVGEHAEPTLWPPACAGRGVTFVLFQRHTESPFVRRRGKKVERVSALHSPSGVCGRRAGGLGDSQARYQAMVATGATSDSEPSNVGGYPMTAAVTDQRGNVMCLTFNP